LFTLFLQRLYHSSITLVQRARVRTEQERSDRVEDTAADDARRPGSGERRHGGKQGSVQEPATLGMVTHNGLTARVRSEPPSADPHAEVVWDP
jgi:hypothetical protein